MLSGHSFADSPKLDRQGDVILYACIFLNTVNSLEYETKVKKKKSKEQLIICFILPIIKRVMWYMLFPFKVASTIHGRIHNLFELHSHNTAVLLHFIK